MKNIIYSLQHIHEKKIMHRDLKPANILCRKKGESYDVVIIDYGLAAFETDNNLLFKRCGSPGYVAPEILCYKVNFNSYNYNFFNFILNY